MLSGLESPSHWLIVIAIALIVFGPKRLPELGRSLGSGIRGFKQSLEGHDEAPAEQLAGGEAVSGESQPPPATADAKPDAP